VCANDAAAGAADDDDDNVAVDVVIIISNVTASEALLYATVVSINSTTSVFKRTCTPPGAAFSL
jgi:hypothetical protein